MMSVAMKRTALHGMIDSFPEELFLELMRFAEFLQFKQSLEKPNGANFHLKAKRKRGFGKHFNFVMADDFDEPLSDFMEYMQ